MAQIDLKNTTVYIYDGDDNDNVILFDMTNANADFNVTPKIIASPANPITLTLVDPGSDGALAVTVDGRDITATLAYATGAVTTTAAQLKAAIEASTAANALVTITYPSGHDGSGIVEAQAKTTIAGQTTNQIEIKIGEGNLTYSEKRPVEFTLDRGSLDEVKEADDEPMDVTFDFTWEYLSSVTGGSTPTVEDALKKVGPAAAWVNASTDACRPHAVNIAIKNAPSCTTVPNEVVEILEFYYEDLSHDLREGAVACTGRSNRVKAQLSRGPSA